MIGKVIGLDLGSKTCGVAISDGLGMYAHPFTTLYYKDEDLDLLQEPLSKIIKEERIVAIALGYPKLLNNDVTESALRSEAFLEKLQHWFNVDVQLVDERLTSVIANRQLIGQDMSRSKRKKVVDQVAAREILQTFLDKKRYEESNNG